MSRLLPLVAFVPGALAGLVSAGAEARPLGLDLGLPSLACPLLLGDEAPLPPPPVVLPPGPEDAAALPPAGFDVVRLRDGRTLRGKILTSVQNGLLFHDAQTGQTSVLPYGDVVDIERPRAPAPLATPELLAQQHRFYLESQLRDLQGRYDALSVWPPVEELIFGLLGVGTAAILYILDSVDGLIWAAFVGVPGLISLVFGSFELASVLHREGDLEEQLDATRAQLARLPGSSSLPRPVVAPIALRF